MFKFGQRSSYIPVKGYSIVLIAFWTFVIAAIVWFDIRRQKSDIMELARHEAIIAFEKDIIVRRWAALHGGVYVQATKDTPPNPLLSGMPERDIKTPSGRELTLMNPAYITRQIHELQREGLGSQGHLTSLNPISPSNAPDAWEKAALLAFEEGKNEVVSVELINGREYLRFMRPLITEEGCLKCHSAQGYRVGDIRGGLSVAVPMQPIVSASSPHRFRDIFGYSFVWLLGLGMVGLGYIRLMRQVIGREEAEQALKAANQQLEKLAVEDALTGLATRRHFNTVLDAEIRRASRRQEFLSLLMCDVDFFKRYNDHYGHVAGDRCLREVAEVIQQTCKRAGQLSARYGGEEFAVIMPGASLKDTKTVAEKIREELAERAIPHEFSDAAGIVTISIGAVSAVVKDSRTADWFVKQADDALYRSKEHGRNRITCVSHD